MKSVEKTAWVVAIGDELISGQRLDTNSQWLSQQLEQLGVQVVRHASVGDVLDAGVALISQAVDSAQIVICTGGIGPTQDDLTRQVIANVAGVELKHIPEIEEHIRQIFVSYGREMPENNKVQACFPVGSEVIGNAEGTAPGIDIKVRDCRVFALPGVPYEMKQMWEDHVEPAIIAESGERQIIRHHVVHCFGGGESQIELMLDGMTDRGHEPRVGITASKTTISLRITATGNSEADCQQQIDSTVEKIQGLLGSFVFGHNGVELQDVVISQLRKLEKTISMVDFAFGGMTGGQLHDADSRKKTFLGAKVLSRLEKIERPELIEAAERVRNEFSSDYGFAISTLYKVDDHRHYDLVVVGDHEPHFVELKYRGHSGLRQSRTAKQIVNEIRLFLARRMG